MTFRAARRTFVAALAEADRAQKPLTIPKFEGAGVYEVAGVGLALSREYLGLFP